MDYSLPPHAVLSGWATGELEKLTGGGALFASFKAFAEGTNLARQYKPYPIGKKRTLHESRETECGQELRLVFGKVRPRRRSSAASDRLPELFLPIRLVGLLATNKKQKRLADNTGKAAWDRLQRWLDAHEGYELDGAG